jgi:hypothetical protein
VFLAESCSIFVGLPWSEVPEGYDLQSVTIWTHIIGCCFSSVAVAFFEAVSCVGIAGANVFSVAENVSSNVAGSRAMTQRLA